MGQLAPAGLRLAPDLARPVDPSPGTRLGPALHLRRRPFLEGSAGRGDRPGPGLPAGRQPSGCGNGPARPRFDGARVHHRAAPALEARNGSGAAGPADPAVLPATLSGHRLGDLPPPRTLIPSIVRNTSPGAKA